MKKTIVRILCAALAAAATLTLAACSEAEIPPPETPPLETPPIDQEAIAIAPGATVKIGDVIEFGGYDWRVLDVQDGKALIITDGVIEERPYYDNALDAFGWWLELGDLPRWATSGMRIYLNGAFYNSFSEAERARIADTNVTNSDNEWFGTDGGEDTIDKIFLLSLSEVVRYFGDSGEFAKGPGELVVTWSYIDADGTEHPYYGYERTWVSDQYDDARVAQKDGSASGWWLRSPGTANSDYYEYYVPCVFADGRVSVQGSRFYGIDYFSMEAIRDGDGYRWEYWVVDGYDDTRFASYRTRIAGDSNGFGLICSLYDVRLFDSGVRPAMWLELE